MVSLDRDLVVRCAQLRGEVQAVERALPSIEEELSGALAHIESAEAFRARPFRLPREASAEGLARFVLGYSAVMQPQATRQLLEESVRAAAGPWLRLSAEAKAGKLADLRAELRRTEALLELDRRAVEAGGDTMLPRDDGTDPGVWLSIGEDLAEIAEGREPT
jgi:multidrug efflux pump subunit AcrA (membrane-fusion protein)